MQIQCAAKIFLPLDILGVSQNSMKESKRHLPFRNISISSGDI